MLVLQHCLQLREEFSLAVVTNDIYTTEDAEFLVRQSALSADRVMGVETGGCPHTAIRDDTTVNSQAIKVLEERFHLQPGDESFKAFLRPIENAFVASGFSCRRMNSK